MAGVRGVGEEVESLVSAASLMFEIPHESLPALADACLEAYVEGLRDVGWRGPAELARAGFLGAAALRYACLAIEVFMVDAAGREWLAAMSGRPWEEGLRRYQDVRLWGLEQEPEARSLLQAVA
jgi:hypothetical protein